MKKKSNKQPKSPLHHNVRFLPYIIAFLFFALCVRVSLLAYHWYLWKPSHFSFISEAVADELPQGQASSSSDLPADSMNPITGSSKGKADAPSAISDDGAVTTIEGKRDVQSIFSAESQKEKKLAEEKKKKEQEEAEKEKSVLSQISPDNVKFDTPQSKKIQTDLFKNLEDRNKEIAAKQERVKQQELLLQAAEQKLIARQKKLLEIEKNIQTLVKNYYDTKGQDQQKLISVYSTMKPKAAAAIFNGMDMNTLLSVVRGMQPKTLAPILAAMDTNKADLVTRKLAGASKLDMGDLSNSSNTQAEYKGSNTQAE